jgi:hypothetical protein
MIVRPAGLPEPATPYSELRRRPTGSPSAGIGCRFLLGHAGALNRHDPRPNGPPVQAARNTRLQGGRGPRGSVARSAFKSAIRKTSTPGPGPMPGASGRRATSAAPCGSAPRPACLPRPARGRPPAARLPELRCGHATAPLFRSTKNRGKPRLAAVGFWRIRTARGHPPHPRPAQARPRPARSRPCRC